MHDACESANLLVADVSGNCERAPSADRPHPLFAFIMSGALQSLREGSKRVGACVTTLSCIYFSKYSLHDWVVQSLETQALHEMIFSQNMLSSKVPIHYHQNSDQLAMILIMAFG